MAEDRRPREALEKALRNACAGLGYEHAAPPMSVVFQREDGFYLSWARYPGHGKPSRGSLFVSKPSYAGKTLKEVRTHIFGLPPLLLKERLVVLDEHARGKLRCVVVIDLETLEPKIINGRIPYVEYSTEAPKEPAETS